MTMWTRDTRALRLCVTLFMFVTGSSLLICVHDGDSTHAPRRPKAQRTDSIGKRMGMPRRERRVFGSCTRRLGGRRGVRRRRRQRRRHDAVVESRAGQRLAATPGWQPRPVTAATKIFVGSATRPLRLAAALHCIALLCIALPRSFAGIQLCLCYITQRTAARRTSGYGRVGYRGVHAVRVCESLGATSDLSRSDA